MTGLWFSPGTPVSSTNKTDRNDITEILLKVVLNTINHKPSHLLTLCQSIRLYCIRLFFLLVKGLIGVLYVCDTLPYSKKNSYSKNIKSEMQRSDWTILGYEYETITGTFQTVNSVVFLYPHHCSYLSDLLY